MRKTKVTTRQVSWFIAAFVMVDIVILSIWYGTDPLRWSLQVANESDGYVTQVYASCDSPEKLSAVFPILLVSWHFVTLLYANYLAYQTIHLHRISDSKSVAVAVFHSIELLVIAIPLMILLQGNVAGTYLLVVLFVSLNNAWVLAIILAKGYACIRGRGNVLPDLHTLRRSTRLSVGRFDSMRIREEIRDPSAEQIVPEQASSEKKLSSEKNQEEQEPTAPTDSADS
jgi:hypothetical protein